MFEELEICIFYDHFNLDSNSPINDDNKTLMELYLVGEVIDENDLIITYKIVGGHTKTLKGEILADHSMQLFKVLKSTITERKKITL